MLSCAVTRVSTGLTFPDDNGLVTISANRDRQEK